MEFGKRTEAIAYSGTVIKKYELLDDILQSVREGNEYRAMAVMKDRNALHAADVMKNELLQWQYECVQIKGLLEYTVRRMGVRELFLNSVNTEFMHKISNSTCVKECKQINLAMIHRYCSLISFKENKKYSFLVQRIIFFTDIDLKQSLTLHFFADLLSVNKCYLSDLFKKETGMTITEYVTKRRIDRAADLLLMTQQSVQEIGEQVGIQDVHYFSRLFKKNTGLTPSQYREQIKI